MGVGFDLERGVGDPIVVLKDVSSSIIHRMGIGGGTGHEMDGGNVHLGGERPNVKIVDVEHTRDRAKFGLKPIQTDTLRRSLDEEAERLVSEPPSPGKDEQADSAAKSGSA